MGATGFSCDMVCSSMNAVIVSRMDSTATSLCMDNDIPLVVFNIEDYENIYRAAAGEVIGTTVGGN